MSLTPPLCVSDLTISNRKEMHAAQGAQAYSSARAALCASLHLAGIEAGSTVCIPSYICGDVSRCLIKAGYVVAYYDTRRDLRVSAAQLAQAIPKETRALLVVHYFGFPQENIAEIVKFACSKDIFLIEDCAHAFLARHNGVALGGFADAAIFSLPKVLPVPDGGLLVNKATSLGSRSAPARPHTGIPTALRLMMSHVAETMGFSPVTIVQLWEKLTGRYPSQSDSGGDEIESVHDLEAGPSRATSLLMFRLNLGRVLRRRRENYRIWLSLLEELREAVFRRELPEGACPWVIPLLINNRDLVRAALERRGIMAVPWPQLPSEINETEHPNAVFLAKHVLLLPVHQSIPQRKVMKAAEIVRQTAKGFGIQWLV